LNHGAILANLNVFHFNDGVPNFEDFGNANGDTYWYARVFMGYLGYEDWHSFSKAINRAIGTCTTLNISVTENFAQCETIIDGVACADYKLSRFACYLIAINGDVKKTQVAAAQAYFVTLADAVKQYVLTTQNVDRVAIREEVSGREITLSGVAYAHGVKQYGYFQNAGYRGMYNMDYRTLKDRKGVSQERTLLDFMHKDELAAHLFRLSLTEGRIKKDGIKGQYPLEQIAEQIGRTVRKTVFEQTGILPENIPTAQDIRVVRRGLKQAHKELKKASPRNKKLLPPTTGN
jgi:DNA-damage-inducible protein D